MGYGLRNVESIDVKANSKWGLENILKGNSILIEGKALNTLLRSIEPMGIHESLIISGEHDSGRTLYKISFKKEEETTMKEYKNAMFDPEHWTFKRFCLEMVNEELKVLALRAMDNGDENSMELTCMPPDEDQPELAPLQCNVVLTYNSEEDSIVFKVSSATERNHAKVFKSCGVTLGKLCDILDYVSIQEDYRVVQGYLLGREDMEYLKEESY